MVSPIANLMGNATVTILGTTVLSIDPAAGVVCGFAITVSMVDSTKA
jgi:hypothetical protein